jgi:hypothetical protein
LALLSKKDHRLAPGAGYGFQFNPALAATKRELMHDTKVMLHLDVPLVFCFPKPPLCLCGVLVNSFAVAIYATKV